MAFGARGSRPLMATGGPEGSSAPLKSHKEACVERAACFMESEAGT
jgi:hypothetical protein